MSNFLKFLFADAKELGVEGFSAQEILTRMNPAQSSKEARWSSEVEGSPYARSLAESLYRKDLPKRMSLKKRRGRR